MLIVPKNAKTRVRREFKRRLRKMDVLGSISLVSAIASLVGVVFGGFDQNAPLALYCLVALSMILMSHYCRSYFSERDESKKVRSSFKQWHDISESIRKAVRKVHESVHGRGPEIQTKEWASSFVEAFRSEAEVMCQSILELMRNLGYPVDRVCIKAFDPASDSLHVIARSGKQAVNETRDTTEAAVDNPFFRLLREVHAHYHTYIQDKEVQAISQCPVLSLGVE